jgi:NitT/TauT family transport system permease protein
MKRFIRGRRGAAVTAALLLFLLWEGAARVVGASILLPRPGEVFGELFFFLGEGSFWEAVAATALRALRSFLITFSAGLVLGLGAGMVPWARAALAPAVTVIRTVPMLSVILLALIWFSSGTVPVFAAFLMSFPIIFENCVQGVLGTDRKLLEMADLYCLGTRRKILHISLPSLLPFLIAGARGTIGMTWKVVIAAEVLTVPRRGIGSGMQFAQINLETGKVMAWTAAAVLLSGASTLVFNGLLRLTRMRRVPVLSSKEGASDAG